MKPRRFQPVAVDVLEDRLVLSAFAVPFSLVTPPASEVNPKFLNLTGRTESLINSSISNAFNRFDHSITNALNAYNKASAHPTPGAPSPFLKLEANMTAALNRLSGDLNYVAHKLPYGGVNLNPTLQHRVSGSAGVTDTTTGVNTPSLQSQLTTLYYDGQFSPSQSRAAINATQSLVRADVKDYINLGVTNGYFRLTRGATLPALS